MASLQARIAHRLRYLSTLAWARALRLGQSCLGPVVVSGLGRLVARRYCTSLEASVPRRRRVLVLRNRYMRNRSQPSNEIGLLDDTLRASGLADFEVLTYDCDLCLSPYSDLQMIRKCSEVRPDLVVLSSWWWHPTHPSLRALQFTRKRLGIPVATIWWDTCSEAFWPRVELHLDMFDMHIVGENPRGHGFDKSHPMFERFLLLWSPFETGAYEADPTAVRDILVSFVGSVNSYRSARKECLLYLTRQGVDGFFAGSDEGAGFSHDQYVGILKRSRMCINFSSSVHGHQLKGRVLEAMLSGALLLESENDQTSMLFNAMEDYVPFSSKEDLLAKIRYFQAHPDEAEAIASAGTRKARALYSGTQFWNAVFKKAGLA